MVMNSQPTLHDSESMLCCRSCPMDPGKISGGVIGNKRQRSVRDIAKHFGRRRCNATNVHFRTQRNRKPYLRSPLCNRGKLGIPSTSILRAPGMDEFDERIQANLDVVLEEVCAALPGGGDHESRKYVAEQLIQCARSGRTTLGELMYTARRAIVHLQKNQRSA